jgi:hypothetical protein
VPATSPESKPSATAKNPSPSPAGHETDEDPNSPQLAASQKNLSPVPKGSPENLPSPSEQIRAAAVATPAIAANAPPPKPILYLVKTEPFSTGGKNFIRYRYDVFNKNDYPAEMFAAAPALPPCGSNTNASRTWVDFFDATGKRIYGFCALSKPADLGLIWIAFEESVIPPSYVYIELNDRQTNTKLKSNLADTTL